MNHVSKEAPLEELVRRGFVQLGYQQLNLVECSTEDGILVLRGQLDSFYLKQVAQTVAVKIAGIRSVKNEIHVG